MKLLSLLLLFLLVGGNVWVEEDCSVIKDGVAAVGFEKHGDSGIARQNCRIANALEIIAEKLK